jgi:hypothetical protein
MNMWRPKPAEEDVSAPPGMDLQNKRRRSRRRAWRDGLADQTTLEDARSYRAFERTLIGSIDPRSVIELALVHRLASLFWRLRRACATETGLLEMQGELPSATRQDPSRGSGPARSKLPPGPMGIAKALARTDVPTRRSADPEPLPTALPAAPGRWSQSHTIAHCFLRLSNLDPTLLDRASSYEAKLWRQAAETIWTLDAMRRPPSAPARRLFRKSMVLSYWDAERSGMR